MCRSRRSAPHPRPPRNGSPPGPSRAAENTREGRLSPPAPSARPLQCRAPGPGRTPLLGPGPGSRASRTRGHTRPRARRGGCGLWSPGSQLGRSDQRAHLDPRPLAPRLQALLRKLHTLRALEERPSERLAADNVAQEELPLGLECVLGRRVLRHLAPALEEPDRLLYVGVPDRPRRVARALGPAVAQARQGGPARPVDLDGEQVVAPHARAPGAVELDDEAVVRAHGRIGGVIRRAPERVALLVEALGYVGRAEARDGRDVTEEVVYDIAPVAEHVHRDAAPVLGAVVPRGALCGPRVAREHPVAELASYRED